MDNTQTPATLNDSSYSQVTLSSPPPNPALNASTSATSDNEPAILSGTSRITSPEANENENAILPYNYTRLAFENVNDYFCHRNGLIEAAVKECVSSLVYPNEDGLVVGSWLLTEISLWDNEKERIVILTKKAIIVIKYDFIALKKMEFRRIPLSGIDTIVVGELIYPKASMVPHLNGIASGLSSIINQCTVNISSPLININKTDSDTTQNNKLFDSEQFKSRNRNMLGVRVMWNQGKPLTFLKKWNPFDNQIPFNTFTFHPLYYHKDVANKRMYDVDIFSSNLISVMEDIRNEEMPCDVNHAPIVLPTYVGLSSFMHNKTAMGFFKVRGKFSF